MTAIRASVICSEEIWLPSPRVSRNTQIAQPEIYVSELPETLARIVELGLRGRTPSHLKQGVARITESQFR